MNTKMIDPRQVAQAARNLSTYSDDDQREARARAEVATLNANALHALRRAFVAITYGGSEWRATKRAFGHIRGLEHMGQLTIVATNGIVAWYLRRTMERYDVSTECYVEVLTPFLGHVSHFSGDVEPLFSVRKPTKAKPEREKRMTKSDFYAAI